MDIKQPYISKALATQQPLKEVLSPMIINQISSIGKHQSSADNYNKTYKIGQRQQSQSSNQQLTRKVLLPQIQTPKQEKTEINRQPSDNQIDLNNQKQIGAGKQWENQLTKLLSKQQGNNRSPFLKQILSQPNKFQSANKESEKNISQGFQPRLVSSQGKKFINNNYVPKDQTISSSQNFQMVNGQIKTIAPYKIDKINGIQFIKNLKIEQPQQLLLSSFKDIDSSDLLLQNSAKVPIETIQKTTTSIKNQQMKPFLYISENGGNPSVFGQQINKQKVTTSQFLIQQNNNFENRQKQELQVKQSDSVKSNGLEQQNTDQQFRSTEMIINFNNQNINTQELFYGDFNCDDEPEDEASEQDDINFDEENDRASSGISEADDLDEQKNDYKNINNDPNKSASKDDQFIISQTKNSDLIKDNSSFVTKGNSSNDFYQSKATSATSQDKTQKSLPSRAKISKSQSSNRLGKLQNDQFIQKNQSSGPTVLNKKQFNNIKSNVRLAAIQEEKESTNLNIDSSVALSRDRDSQIVMLKNVDTTVTPMADIYQIAKKYENASSCEILNKNQLEQLSSDLQRLLLKIEPPRKPVPGQELSKKEKFLAKAPNKKIVVHWGPIPGRQPTVFFNYPPYLGMQRPYRSDKIQIFTQEQLQPFCYLSFRINSSTHTYNCVVNALKMAGFHMVKNSNGPTSWNILWTTLIRSSKLKSMNQFQRVNHFAGAWQLGSKANLWRNVQKFKRRHGKPFDIAPTTYIFPEDYKRWQNDREMNNFKDMYIYKPTSSSCGRGIKIIGKKDNVNKRAGFLVSKYLEKPHLLRGYKYDLRIYIVVTCYEPLKAYIFKEGLVRLATCPYTTNKNSLKKRFVHLTNYSVNKKNENFVKNVNTAGNNLVGGTTNFKPVDEKDDAESIEADETPSAMPFESKWSLKMLKEEYERNGIDFDDIFNKIKELCLKTLISVEPHIVSQSRTTKFRNQCFEVYGFDVLIDDTLRPWLLEVNVAPSLSSSSPFDKTVKSMLLSDTFHLIGFTIFDRQIIHEEQKLQKKRKLMGATAQQLAGFTQQSGASNLTNLSASFPFQNNENELNQSSFKSKQKFQSSPQKKKNLENYSINGDNSPEKFKVKDKLAVGSFLQGFDFLTEDDLDLLACFEEEAVRAKQTQFERIFPTKEQIENLGKYFECQRHANNLLWQYIAQKCPIAKLQAYYKAFPQF